MHHDPTRRPGLILTHRGCGGLPHKCKAHDPSMLHGMGALVSACVLADPAGGVGGLSKAPVPRGVWVQLVSGPSGSFR